MQVAIRGKNVEVSDALKEYIEKKLTKLDKYFYRNLSAQVALNVERGRHIIEVTIPLDGILLRGEEASEDMYASVDQVLDKLERQIHKYKTKINRKLRREAGNHRGVREDVSSTDESSPEVKEEVVKVKRFPVKPMEVEEAIMQMNLLAHDFYVFTNAKTEEINVVYRRRDGGFGLIEPNF